jgi:hypothetical protein
MVARYAVPAAVLAVLAWPRMGRPRARSWWWLLLPAAAMLPLAGDGWALAQAGLEVGLLLVVLVVAVAALDPRPAIGAAVYLAPGLVYAVEETVAFLRLAHDLRYLRPALGAGRPAGTDSTRRWWLGVVRSWSRVVGGGRGRSWPGRPLEEGLGHVRVLLGRGGR